MSNINPYIGKRLRLATEANNFLDYQYLLLLEDIMENGVRKETRNGVIYSVFGRQITHNMRTGFPLLTTKKMAWKHIVSELIWFLSGSTNIQPLVNQGNYIWVGDAYKNYMSIEGQPPHDHTLSRSEFIEMIRNNNAFAEKYGELGKVYGAQWRNFGGDETNILQDIYDRAKGIEPKGIDQIREILKTLQENPDSRRMMVTAWNPLDLDSCVLPPCHYGFQVWTRELTLEERYEILNERTEGRYGTDNESDNPLAHYNIPDRGISLLWNQRSVDVPLGLPFNIASYGLLLEMIANEVGMLPLELIGNLGDTHIYENQMDGVKEQLTRNFYKLPTVDVEDGIWSFETDIHLMNYVSEEKIEFPLSN